MYVLQFFVANVFEMCPRYNKSHVLKTNLICLALDETYILLKYIYIYICIAYIVINKNKLT